jgi:ribonucleotide reductase beta subunit family protein with ferritin-like domain
MNLKELLNNEHTEPILSNTINRYVMFPIKYKDIWDIYKKAVASFWTPEEISFSDVDEWNRLSSNEQHFIKYVLAFFAGSDGIVNENLASRFMNDVSLPEAKAFYTFQLAIESIHSETYSLLIDTYVKDNKEKETLFNAIEEVPCIKEKANWAFKWIEDKDSPFAARLVAFAIVEGVFFSSAFASIYFIKEKGLLHSLTFSNELISRDESLHTEFAIMLYSHLENKMTQEDVHKIMKEAVDIEVEFVKNSLPCGLLGMNSDLMIQYVKFIADRLLKQLGYDVLYAIHNCPLDFMERISITNKSNFFEVRVAEYSKANVGGKKETMELYFNNVDDVDF